MGPDSEHKRMVSKRKPMPTPSERIDYVIAACNVPSDAAFGRWIKVKNPQNVRAWRNRGISRDGAILIGKASGASLDFLLSDKGEPFPDGPILYRPARPEDMADQLTALEGEVDDAAAVLAALVRILSEKLPGAAEALHQAQQALPAGGSSSLVREAVAAAVAEARPPSATAGRAGEPGAPSGSPRRSGR